MPFYVEKILGLFKKIFSIKSPAENISRAFSLFVL
jgi:hypothetical protein